MLSLSVWIWRDIALTASGSAAPDNGPPRLSRRINPSTIQPRNSVPSCSKILRSRSGVEAPRARADPGHGTTTRRRRTPSLSSRINGSWLEQMIQ